METRRELPPNRELDELRDKIDRIDKQIIPLFAERFRLTEEIGLYKKEHQMNPEDASREEEIRNKRHLVCEQEGIGTDTVDAIYECVLRQVKKRHAEIRES